MQKTAAGTVGALAVMDAPLILCAGFVVAEATAQVLRGCGSPSVTFVVTGDDGRADEDLACAQYIAGRAAGVDVPADEFLRRAAGARAAADLAEGVRQGFRGVHRDDVALCLEADRFPFAMVAQLEGTLMVLRARAVPADGEESGTRRATAPC